MKNFIDHIQKSIYGPEYYRELTEKPSSFSWKYYWSLALLLSVFMTIVSSLPLIPQINTALREIPAQFFAYYPDELELKIEKGHITSNVEEPYYLPIPPEWAAGLKTPSDIEHLGVIDTKTPVSLAAFKAYKAGFWVAGDSLVAIDQNGGVSIMEVNKDINYTVSETNMHAILTMITPYFKFVPPAVVVIIFVGMMVTFLINLAYLLIWALFIFLMGKFMKYNWSYGLSYRLGLHATTLPLLVATAVTFLPLGSVKFLSTALILGVVYVNFKRKEEPPKIDAVTAVPPK